LYYWWKWGDGNNSGWLGSYPQGQKVNTSHIWDKEGTYSIKVKTKDILGKESEWSDSLEVTMPRNKAMFNTVLFRFLERLILSFPIIKALYKSYN